MNRRLTSIGTSVVHMTLAFNRLNKWFPLLSEETRNGTTNGKDSLLNIVDIYYSIEPFHFLRENFRSNIILDRNNLATCVDLFVDRSFTEVRSWWDKEKIKIFLSMDVISRALSVDDDFLSLFFSFQWQRKQQENEWSSTFQSICLLWSVIGVLFYREKIYSSVFVRICSKRIEQKYSRRVRLKMRMFDQWDKLTQRKTSTIRVPADSEEKKTNRNHG